MLASALELEDSFGIRLDAFHTYDKGRRGGHPEGKGKGKGKGKGVPLLCYDEWLDDVDIEGDVKRVVDLNRCQPIHNAPELPLE